MNKLGCSLLLAIFFSSTLHNTEAIAQYAECSRIRDARRDAEMSEIVFVGRASKLTATVLQDRQIDAIGDFEILEVLKGTASTNSFKITLRAPLGYYSGPGRLQDRFVAFKSIWADPHIFFVTDGPGYFAFAEVGLLIRVDECFPEPSAAKTFDGSRTVDILRVDAP
jgi:hypothetical protein